MNSDLRPRKYAPDVFGCLIIYSSCKTLHVQFGPKKVPCDRKMKGRLNQGNAWLPWEWFLADCLPCRCLNKEGRMITRTKFVWLWGRGGNTHMGSSVHFLGSYK